MYSKPKKNSSKKKTLVHVMYQFLYDKLFFHKNI